MFGSIGGPELLLILVIALLVFGPRKLPDLGRTIGRAMAEFRRASNDFRSTLEKEIDAEKQEIVSETKGLASDLEAGPEAADESAPAQTPPSTPGKPRAG